MSRRSSFVVAACCALTYLGGCDDEDHEDHENHDGHDHDAATSEGGDASSGPDGGGDGEPLYAISTQIMSTDTSMSYVAVVPSLQDGERVEARSSIELPDASFLAAHGTGSFYVVFSETPKLTRYDVTGTEIDEGPSISFASHGVTSGPASRSLRFVSETKAYFFDNVSLQVLVLDLEDMRISDAIDLGELAMDGWLTQFDYMPKRRGDEFVLAVYYLDSTFSEALPDAALVFIDTDTDETEIVHDSACGGFSSSAMMPSGDIYFASDPFFDILHRLGGEDASPASCIRRLPTGERELDPDFDVTITEVADGFGGGIVPGEGNTAYLRIYDESEVPITDESDGFTLYGAPGWRFVRIDLDTLETTAITDIPFGSATFQWFEVDGHAYMADASADYSSTTLLDMTGAEEPTQGLEVEGLVGGIARVR